MLANLSIEDGNAIAAAKKLCKLFKKENPKAFFMLLKERRPLIETAESNLL